MVVSMRSNPGSFSRDDEFAVTELSSVRGVVLVEVSIDHPEAPRESVLGELHPAERAFACSKPGRRLVEFVAGRRALRVALRHVGWGGDQPLLTGPQGRPEVPLGFTASVSHKDGLAFAVAAPADSGRTLGIDCEVIGDRARSSIARKILRPSELLRWQTTGSTWPALLEIFSTKEAIYKALHPHVPRYIGFEEAEVDELGGIRLHLSGGEGPFRLHRHLSWDEQRLIVLVEAEPG